LSGNQKYPSIFTKQIKMLQTDMPRLSQKRIKELKAGYNPERYTLKGLISDFFNSIYHLGQKKIVHTTIELTLRPAKAVKNVLKGFRQYLYNPLEYLVVIATLISLLNNRYHFFSNEATAISANNDTSGIYQVAFFYEHRHFLHNFFKYSEDYPSVVNIVAIPVFALVTYLFFRRYKFNLAENLILSTYITAQQLLFLVLLIPFDEFLPASKGVLISVYTIGTMIYNIWVYSMFFEGKMLPKIIRGIGAVLVAYVVQIPINLLVYYLFAPIFEFFSKLL